jgi:uncharacterized protein (DUF362 family)
MLKDPTVVVRDARGKDTFPVVRDLLDRLGVGKAVEGKSVVLKPNLCTERAEILEVANTSPVVVEAVVRYLRDHTPSIVIGESDGTRYSANEAFRNNGTYELGRKYGVKVQNFTEDVQVAVAQRDLAGWTLARTWLDADVFITIPKLKTHATAYFTGALKNQWGCIPRSDRILLHRKLDELIGVVNSLRPVDFAVMDGLVAMEGRGPINGTPVALDVLIAANDPVAIDVYAMSLAGLIPEKSRHVMYAGKVLNLGETSIDRMVLDSDLRRGLPALQEARTDWAIKTMNVVSRSEFLTRQLIMNDGIFYPLRSMVQRIRNVVG